jgi:hypothetical protein
VKSSIVRVCCAAFLSVPSIAAADPIALTSGWISRSDDPTGGQVFAPGLDIFFLSDVGAFPMFVPVGETIDFSGSLPLINTWAPATVNGERVVGNGPPETGGAVWIGGSFNISAVPVAVSGRFSAPFSLTGTLIGRATPESAPLFSIDVTGRGTLFSGGRLVQLPDPNIRINSVTFRLDAPDPNPSPTPEPATWLLVTGGGAAMAFVRTRRARRQSS